jgi:hypothetical protein
MAAAAPSATKTIFGVPAPKALEGYVVPGQQPQQPRASQPAAPAVTAEADSARTETAKVDRKTGARKTDVPAPAMTAAPARPTSAPVEAPAAEPSEPQPSTQPGYDAKSRKRTEPAAPAPVAAEKPRPARGQTPIWTYIGVGFAFGLILLGIYQLVGLLKH